MSDSLEEARLKGLEDKDGDASSKGNAVFSFVGPGFVGVCLEWGAARSRCFVVNVYSKCSLAEKRQLWRRRFTWVQPYGGAASRLAWFLVSEGWLDAWGEVSQWVLPRDVSDHCPLVLRYLAQLWGLKPF
ncbi:frigida-like protein, partial [Trifolium medium]|nr:frigida-like protein [Trifolium medium]